MSRRTSLLKLSRVLSTPKPRFTSLSNRAIRHPPNSSPSLVRFNSTSALLPDYRPFSMGNLSDTLAYYSISDALLSGNLASLKKTLAECSGLDLNVPFSEDPETLEPEPLLHRVLRTRLNVKPDDIEMIKALVEHGCDINTYWADAGGTILDQAARLESVPLLEFLVKNGASVSTNKEQHPDSISPLAYAVSSRRIKNAQFLISSGAVVDTDSIESSQSTEMLELLLSHASDSVIAESRPVHAAARTGDAKYLTTLLEKKFDVNAFDRFGQTPLLVACESSRPSQKIVDILIKNGADASAKSKCDFGGNIDAGDTPLHVSAWRSDFDVVQSLLNANLDINARNYYGQTPLIKFGLYLAQVCSKRVESSEVHPRQRVMQLLVDGGAYLNAVDIDGNTALHTAAMARKYGPLPLIWDIMKLLLDSGANHIADAKGVTPLRILEILEAEELIVPLTQYLQEVEQKEKAV